MNLIKRVEFFNNLGYKIDSEFIKGQFKYDILKNYSSAVPLITQNVFINNKFPDLINTCLEVINDYINVGFRNLNSISINELDLIKTNLVLYPEVYSNIFNTYKSYYLNSPYYLRARQDHSTNFEGTIRNLKFFGYTNIDLPFEKLKEIFERDVSSYDIGKLLQYLIDKGYEITTKKTYDFIIGSFNSHANLTDRLIFCIENNIDVDNCYDKLVDYVDKLKTPLSSYDSKKIKNVIANSDKYKDSWEDREKVDRQNKVLAHTLASSKYWSNSSVRGESTLNPEKWYTEYFEELKEINITGKYEGFKSAIGAIVLLASLNKFDDFDKIKYDFLNSRSDSFSSPKGSLVDLCKIVAQMKVTNWDWTWRIYLDPEQRKAIYEWLNKKVDSEPTLENRSIMQVCYFLYNKDKYEKLLSDIKKYKGNIKAQWYGEEKPRVSTNRVQEFKPIIQYLTQRGKFDDIKKVLNVFKSISLYKAEKELISRLKGSNLFYSKSDEDDDKTIHTSKSREYEKKLKEVIDEFLQTLNESRIIKWNDFIR